MPLKNWTCLNKFKKSHWCIIEQAEIVTYTSDMGNAGKTPTGRAESSPPQKLQVILRALKTSFVARGEESRYDLPLILRSWLKGITLSFQMMVLPWAAKIVSDNSVSEGR